jgi:hypothetical protein
MKKSDNFFFMDIMTFDSKSPFPLLLLVNYIAIPVFLPPVFVRRGKTTRDPVNVPGLTKISPSGKLNVLLKEEALKNVISSLKAEGHKVTRVARQGAVFLLVVEKDGAAA